MASNQAPRRELHVDGYTYHIGCIEAFEGLRISGVLMNMLGPVLAGLKPDMPIEAALAVGFIRLSQHPDLPTQLPMIARVLASGTQLVWPGGEKSKTLSDVASDHFAGNYGALMQWLALAIEVNFASFFAGLGPLKAYLESALAAHASKSPSPQAKTG